MHQHTQNSVQQFSGFSVYPAAPLKVLLTLVPNAFQETTQAHNVIVGQEPWGYSIVD